VYEKYYNFTGIPFQLTPDSRFFFTLPVTQPEDADGTDLSSRVAG